MFQWYYWNYARSDLWFLDRRWCLLSVSLIKALGFELRIVTILHFYFIVTSSPNDVTFVQWLNIAQLLHWTNNISLLRGCNFVVLIIHSWCIWIVRTLTNMIEDPYTRYSDHLRYNSIPVLRSNTIIGWLKLGIAQIISSNYHPVYRVVQNS